MQYPKADMSIHDQLVIEMPAVLCRNCKRSDRQHVDGKCMFDSTTLEPMNDEDRYAWMLSLFSVPFNYYARPVEYLGKFPTKEEE